MSPRSSYSTAGLGVLLLVTPIASVYASRGLPTFVAIAGTLALAGHASLAAARSAPSVIERFRAVFGARAPDSAIIIPLFALIAYGATTALWSLDFAYSLERAAKLLLCVVIAGLVYRLLPERDEGYAGWLGAAGIALAAGLLIVELIGHGLFREIRYNNGDPQMLNRSVVIVGFLMCPVLALQRGHYKLAIRCALLVLVGIAALLSESQTAQVSLVIGILAATAAWLAPRLVVPAFRLGGVTLIWAMPFLAHGVRAFAPTGLMGKFAELPTVQLRLDFWMSYAEAVFARPIRGWGMGASRFFGVKDLEEFSPGLDWSVGIAHHPHNPILEVWVDLGAVGALLASLIFVAIVRAAGRLSPAMLPMAFGCLGAVLVVSTISHGIWQTWWLTLLGVVVSLLDWADRRECEAISRKRRINESAAESQHSRQESREIGTADRLKLNFSRTRCEISGTILAATWPASPISP